MQREEEEKVKIKKEKLKEKKDTKLPDFPASLLILTGTSHSIQDNAHIFKYILYPWLPLT